MAAILKVRRRIRNQTLQSMCIYLLEELSSTLSNFTPIRFETTEP